MVTERDDPRTCQTLMQRAGQGDTAAFAEFYDRTVRAVFGLASSVLAEAAGAAEITRNVYLQAWRTASQYDHARCDPVTLLMTMAHRHALDRIRTLRAADGAPIPAWSDGSLEQLLGAVPPGSREVLIMTYFRGHTLDRVADLLNIPQATAASRLNEALSSLRRTGLPTPVDDTHQAVAEPSRARQRDGAR